MRAAALFLAPFRYHNLNVTQFKCVSYKTTIAKLYFHTSAPLLKKRPKVASSEDRTKSPAQSDASAKSEDPLDLSGVEKGIERALERMKSKISLLRPGGRFNPALLEALPVIIDKRGGKPERLGDVAQVVPRSGAALIVMVGDLNHVKAVKSAIQSSTYSLTPQPVSGNEYELRVPIPPPTMESRQEGVEAIKKARGYAVEAVRQVRMAEEKRLKALREKRMVHTDDFYKASERMEKAIKKGQEEVKKVSEAAERVMAG